MTGKHIYDLPDEPGTIWWLAWSPDSQRLAISRAMLKRPKILVFDEATSSLDQHTAERFAQTVNRLKGMAMVLFIAHQLPKGLAVDEVFTLTGEKATQMRVVDDGQP